MKLHYLFCITILAIHVISLQADPTPVRSRRFLSDFLNNLFDSVNRVTQAAASALRVEHTRALVLADTATDEVRRVVLASPASTNTYTSASSTGVTRLHEGQPYVYSTSVVSDSDGTVVRGLSSASSGLIQTVVRTPERVITTVIDASTGEVISRDVQQLMQPASQGTVIRDDEEVIRPGEEVPARRARQISPPDGLFLGVRQHLQAIMAAVDLTTRQAIEFAAMATREAILNQGDLLDRISQNAQTSLRNLVGGGLAGDGRVENPVLDTSRSADGVVLARISNAPASTTVAASTTVVSGFGGKPRIESVVSTDKGQVRTLLDGDTGEVISQEVLSPSLPSEV